MKSLTSFLFLFLVLIFGFQDKIFAASFDLREGDFSLKPIKGKILEVKPLCPRGMTCLTDGTVVVVEFVLLGCLDRLGPVAYKIVPREDKTVDIYLNVINIHNENSIYTDCIRAPTATHTITLVQKFYKKDQIRLQFLSPKN